MLRPHHVKAPKGDGALLCEPPLSEAQAHLERNLRKLSDWTADIQGRQVTFLRELARREVLRGANSYLERLGYEPTVDPESQAPLVVTGHQPELFHPGVWVKNFAAASIARESSGVALNLIVDNDIPKSSSLTVPSVEHGALHGKSLDYDLWAGEVPFEDWVVQDTDQFANFGQNVQDLLDPMITDPLIGKTWPLVMEASRDTDRVGLRFSSARRRIEEEFGIQNLEIPLSMVCQTEAFRWFLCHVLAQLPRFVKNHNEALAEYRTLYRIRSKNHPVAGLDHEGDWAEAPFWVWRAEAPRRRPLLVRQNARTMDLKIAGEPEAFARLSLAPDREACCAVEELAKVAAEGIRIRTRALTTTMFARLFLGDLFIHGIGGAKYDELGDEVIRRFFRIEPPRFVTLSMTLWIGHDVDPTLDSRLARNHRRRRDLTYQPERFLADSTDQEIVALRARKAELLRAVPGTRRERVKQYRDLRASTSALSSFLGKDLEATADERVILERKSRENAVAKGRDWSFVMHSEERIRNAIAKVDPRSSAV